MRTFCSVLASIIIAGGMLAASAAAEAAAPSGAKLSAADEKTTEQAIGFAVVGAERIDDQEQARQTVRRALEKALSKKGFKIFDFTQLKEVRRKEFRALLGDKKKLAAVRGKIKADIAIDYVAEAEFKREIDLQGHPAYNYEAQLEVRIIDLDTAKILRTIEPKPSQAAALDKKKAARKALTKAAEGVVGEIIKTVKPPADTDKGKETKKKQ
ncbi:hypothetical protein ACFL34_03680 [Candidatus Sumerlaeota bacterium]